MSKSKRERIVDPFHTGHKLRRLREDDRYTLEDAADRLKVGRTTLSDYELGVVLPTRSVLEKAAVLYKVDLGLFYSTERLPFNQHNNQQANGYVNEQHNTDKELRDRLLAHIEDRANKTDELFARFFALFEQQMKKG